MFATNSTSTVTDLPHGTTSTPSALSGIQGSLTRATAKAQALAAFLLRGFEIDLRSLAVFRIGLGIMLLATIWFSLVNVEAFYSDAGVYPRALLLGRDMDSEGMWSLHLVTGSAWAQAALLLVQGAAALCMIVGYRTRLAVFVSWFMLISLQSRNATVCNGADVVMRLLLFWSLFLPMAARWSVDNLKTGLRPSQASLLNFGTVALLLQVAFIYTFSAMIKSWDLWFVQGRALFITLQLDAFVTPLGLWLRSHEVLCQWFCRGAVILEFVGPVLALMPVFRPQLRIAMGLSFVAFHAGIGLAMSIGVFPWLMMAVWCLLLPTELWNWLGRLQWVQSLAARISEKFPQTKTRAEPCPDHLKQGLQPGAWTRRFAVFCLVYVCLWNFRGMNFELWEKVLPKSVNGFAFALRLDQYWCMFAPTPSTEDGWTVLQADLADGTQVDLLSKDGTLSWDKPKLASSDYKDNRWQKYLMNMWESKYAQHRPWLGNYLATKWNESHGGLSQVSAWELSYMRERTNMDGTVQPVEKIPMWKCQSFAGKP